MNEFVNRLDYAASTVLAVATGGWLLLMLGVVVLDGPFGLGWGFWVFLVLLPALFFWLAMSMRRRAIRYAQWLYEQQQRPNVVINVQQDYQPPRPRPRDQRTGE